MQTSTAIQRCSVGHKVVHCSVQVPMAPPPAPSRRGILSAAAALLAATLQQRAASAAPIPPSPAVGDCPECIGEVNETLNACSLESPSCISTLSDDEQHFVAPWAFDGSRDAAIARLVEVATGGAYEPGLVDTFGGVKQTDAALFVAKGVASVVSGGNLPFPERPQRSRKSKSDLVPFDGAVVERHTTASGAEYVRILLGAQGGSAQEVEDPLAVIDAEFLFLPDDNIVDVRAASRTQPEGSGLGPGSSLALSFTQGLVVDRNVARREMERLRDALRWEITPVVADFNPAFNSEAPVFVERLFDPFNKRNSFEPSGVAYPAEGGQ